MSKLSYHKMCNTANSYQLIPFLLRTQQGNVRQAFSKFIIFKLSSFCIVFNSL